MMAAVVQDRASGVPTVLVVEGDVLVRNPLAEYLRECGYRVLTASTPAEAHQAFADGGQHIDVVLIDVEVPDDGGFVLATWLRQRPPGTRIVLASTIEKVAEQAGALCEEGPALRKPYDHQLVLRRIKQLLASRDRARNPERP